MKTIVETFIYEVPDDCDDYLRVKDYVDFVDDMTCPFYDGIDEFIPELKNHHIEETND